MQIIPSLFSSVVNLPEINLEQTIECLVANKIKGFHIDIMDKTQTPNTGMDPKIILKIPEKITCDIHIMTSNPANYIASIPERNNTIVHTHLRMAPDYQKFINQVTSKKMQCGLTIDLDDSLNEIYKLIDQIQIINFMSVKQIGSTKQKFYDEVLVKIKMFKDLYPNYKGKVMVDGSIKTENLKPLSNYCDYAVIGHILFKNQNLKKNLEEILSFYEN